MSSVCGKHPLQSSLFQRYISGGYYNCNVRSTSINQVPVTQYFLYFFSLPSSLCFTDVLQRYMCNEVITSRSGNHYIQCGQCLLTWLIIGLLYFATSAWLDLEIISRSYNYRYLSSLVQLLCCNPFSMFSFPTLDTVLSPNTQMHHRAHCSLPDAMKTKITTFTIQT